MSGIRIDPNVLEDSSSKILLSGIKMQELWNNQLPFKGRLLGMWEEGGIRADAIERARKNLLSSLKRVRG